jgi:hypothetical protein
LDVAPSPTILVLAMKPHPSRVSAAFSALFALSAFACQEAPPLVASPSLAERFAADLGSPEGAALAPWFRQAIAPTLRRRCPDCPESRRVVETAVTFLGGGRTLGASISAGPEANAGADISALRLGELRCEGACCTWSVGLLDHGAAHLERACFGRDQTGPYLTTLWLVDG